MIAKLNSWSFAPFLCHYRVPLASSQQRWRIDDNLLQRICNITATSMFHKLSWGEKVTMTNTHYFYFLSLLISVQKSFNLLTIWPLAHCGNTGHVEHVVFEHFFRFLAGTSITCGRWFFACDFRWFGNLFLFMFLLWRLDASRSICPSTVVTWPCNSLRLKIGQLFPSGIYVQERDGEENLSINHLQGQMAWYRNQSLLQVLTAVKTLC